MTTASMSGKVCLVTGANSGIGKHTAQELARLGATVVLVCRDTARGQQAVDEILHNVPGAKIELIAGDMSSQASIRACAAEFLSRYSRLDVLVNNAGAMNSSRADTVDGLERTFATNHLGYFLFTHELLEVLKRSAPARIVNVSSHAHYKAQLHLDDPNFKKRMYNPWQAYCESKLYNVLFTSELARRLEGTGVTVNAMHPGFVRTGFGGRAWYTFAVWLGQLLFARSVEKGAETVIWLATDEAAAQASGQYFMDKRARRPSVLARDENAQKTLWQLSEQLTKTTW